MIKRGNMQYLFPARSRLSSSLNSVNNLADAFRNRAAIRSALASSLTSLSDRAKTRTSGIETRGLERGGRGEVLFSRGTKGGVGGGGTITAGLGNVASRVNEGQQLRKRLIGGERSFAIVSPHMNLPLPPPREFNADGSPKKYRLNQKIYEHQYNYERWTVYSVGSFHTVYHVDFAQDLKPFTAWFYSHSFPTMLISKFLALTAIATCWVLYPQIGLKPKHYTVEWQEKMRERDRAENSNSITCYLDRRRKERGPHWILADHIYGSLYQYNTYATHDTQLLRERKETQKEEAAESSED